MKQVSMNEAMSNLDVAKQVYSDLVTFLNEKVFSAREAFEKNRGNNEYKGEYCLNAFNLLLEYSFLEIASADNNIHENEIKAIMDILDPELIEELISELVEEKFAITDFLKISSEETAKLLKALCKPIFDISKDFIYSFLMFDESSEKDYLEYLERCALAFLTCIRSIDGEVKEEENCKCLLIYLIEQMKQGKKKVKPVSGGSDLLPDLKIIQGAEKEAERVRTHKSLKDCYQKKKVSIQPGEHQVDYNEKIKATVYIEVEKGKEDGGSGSGFVITESGLCFTCYHVVKGADEIYVRLDDGEGNRIVKPAVLQYFDEDDDFAVIQILDIEWAYHFKLEDNYSEVSMGDEIAVFGFPLGRHINEDVLELEPSLLRGYVACKNRLEDKMVYYLDARSCPGNSGGPVFSLKTNKVIGYLCGSYGPDRANLVYCRSLTEFFKNVVNK